MANHSSAKKAIKQINKRTKINKSRLTRIKTMIKIALFKLDNSSADEANAAFKKAQSEIAKAVSKGIFKKNTAARKTSNLSTKFKLKFNS